MRLAYKFDLFSIETLFFIAFWERDSLQIRLLSMAVKGAEWESTKSVVIRVTFATFKINLYTHLIPSWINSKKNIHKMPSISINTQKNKFAFYVYFFVCFSSKLNFSSWLANNFTFIQEIYNENDKF